jgi:hypothetical protein
MRSTQSEQAMIGREPSELNRSCAIAVNDTLPHPQLFFVIPAQAGMTKRRSGIAAIPCFE